MRFVYEKNAFDSEVEIKLHPDTVKNLKVRLFYTVVVGVTYYALTTAFRKKK
jgi:hypothetical protein